jgi:ATP-binding cassette subfamily B (MDR/TAP) protein 1
VLAISQANYYLTDPDQVLRKSSIVAFVFLGMSVIAMVGAILQIYGFTQMGERITCKVRSDMFEAILRREVAYFDNEDNSVGRLTSRLANDANTVSKAFGLGLSRQFQCLFTLIVGLGFALFNAWKMALVVLATFPITVVSAMIEDATYKGAQYGSADAKDSQKDVDIISNAFTSMRTVTAFSVQYQVAALYEEVTLQRNKDMVRGRMITGLGFAGVQAVSDLCA